MSVRWIGPRAKGSATGVSTARGGQPRGSERVTGSGLRCTVDVGGVDHGDHRVAAGHRVVGAEHDRLPAGGTCTAPRTIASDFSSSSPRRRSGVAVEPDADPVGVAGHPPRVVQHPLHLTVGEPVVARPDPDAQHQLVRGLRLRGHVDTGGLALLVADRAARRPR